MKDGILKTRRNNPIIGHHPPQGQPLLCHNCGCPLGLKGTKPAIKVPGPFVPVQGYMDDVYIHDGGCPHPLFTDYHRRQWGLPPLYSHLFRLSLWQRIVAWFKSLKRRFFS